MNKSRVEAFTDAVIAIILTIMILEFKTPESAKLSAILPQVPYLISYAVGYLFIGVAWYNHHYMFSKTRLITKEVYWTNNFWMFATSFIPVATAWVGENMNARGPEIFYAGCYVFWTLAYILLTHKLIKANEIINDEAAAQSLRDMKIYRVLTNWRVDLVLTLCWILVLMFIPAAQMVLVVGLIIFVGADFNEDSDRIFAERDNDI